MKQLEIDITIAFVIQAFHVNIFLSLILQNLLFQIYSIPPLFIIARYGKMVM